MADLKTAMLARDEKSLRGLRAIKAAILLAKTSEGAGGELKEDDEIKLLQKLVKQRKDSLEIYQQQNRSDLAQKEQEEIEVIEKFLPTQLSTEELQLEIKKITHFVYHHILCPKIDSQSGLFTSIPEGKHHGFCFLCMFRCCIRCSPIY